MNVLKRGVLPLGVMLLSLYGLACLYLTVQQRQRIYTVSYEVMDTPAKFNLTYEEFWLPVSSPVSSDRNSESLHSWFLPPDDPSSSLGTLLYFHGVGENMTYASYVREIYELWKMGFAVMTFDPRGYGQSEGEFPAETRIYEDAQVALNYLRESRDIPDHQIYLFGTSLGGAVALDLALREPDLAGVITASTFTSMADQVASMGYWMFPLDLMITEKFDSLQKVPSLPIPVLLTHAGDDDYVPPWMSEKLYEAAPEPKQLIIMPGFTHDTNAQMIASDRFEEEVKAFVESTQQRP